MEAKIIGQRSWERIASRHNSKSEGVKWLADEFHQAEAVPRKIKKILSGVLDGRNIEIRKLAQGCQMIWFFIIN